MQKRPCLWNGMKRPCYLFARKFYPEALDNLMNIFSNFTVIWQSDQCSHSLLEDHPPPVGSLQRINWSPREMEEFFWECYLLLSSQVNFSSYLLFTIYFINKVLCLNSQSSCNSADWNSNFVSWFNCRKVIHFSSHCNRFLCHPFLVFSESFVALNS